jgi:hypothetical protein
MRSAAFAFVFVYMTLYAAVILSRDNKIKKGRAIAHPLPFRHTYSLLLSQNYQLHPNPHSSTQPAQNICFIVFV